ncbi:hypothetical protein G6011_00991 [Alternaria panax]|uniref:Heterokaryon incompatibility domain-containing protein n=1 Tax=Alternaria panax TaxID=48097 RepID=A0AAD4IJN1_9PLEO|nr:hypothetical protein G6011_00991 [Alternaria panax]
MALSENHTLHRHVHAALQGPDHIRLIALHPALSEHDPLRINFLSSSHKDLQGQYDAISYTWGEPVLTFPLHLDNGTQLHVTSNLDRALRYLRYKDRDRLLWADAASINQIDNDEKAVQIPLMVQIFRGARRVMAWLDPGRDTTVEQRGMRKVDQLSRTSKEQTEESLYPAVNVERNDEFKDVLQFLKLPWFNRLWIVQEIVFSLDIYLICGGTELTFSRLIAALSVVEKQRFLQDPDDKALMEAVVKIGKLWNRHSLFGTEVREVGGQDEYFNSVNIWQRTKILSLVESFRSYGCTDPRDRVFAVYSMATDVRPIRRTLQTDEASPSRPYSGISMSIDYSLDIRESYEAFALSYWRDSIDDGQMWDALLSRQHSPQAADWSSWVPDWRVPPRTTWLLRPCPRDYPDLRVSEDGTGIHMHMNLGRHLRDHHFRSRYTVKLKTSINAKDCTTPFVSQLLQLYELLRKPGAICKTPRLSSRFPTTRHNVRTTSITNVLVEMIRALKPKHRRKESLVELDQYLANRALISGEGNSRLSPIQPSTYVQQLINELDQDLGDKELFCFQDERSRVHSVGCGNMELIPGDQIVPVKGWEKSETCDGLIMVLILRKVDRADGASWPNFRLIGSGYILHPEFFWHFDNWTRFLKQDRKTLTEMQAWNMFAGPFYGNGYY